MKAYFLIRESVALAHAFLAVPARLDVARLPEWMTDWDVTEVCLLGNHEFERAKLYEGAIVLSSELMRGEGAIVFMPRDEWPEDFTNFRNYFEQSEKRREDRENITEEKWLGRDHDPINLANFALPRYNARRIRLFAVACCDLVADKLVDPRSRRAVEVALRHANGTASDEELKAAADEAEEAVIAIMRARGRGCSDQISPEYGAAALASNATASFDRTTTPDSPDGWLSLCAAGTVSDFLIWHTMRAAKDNHHIAEKITGLLRDLCGNPFRPVMADLAWQSPDLQSLARDIYDRKAFDRLPALANALEGAGCTELAILEHCRIPGPHVRGCWVVDLVLGVEPL